jgi:hypothetical protein
LVSGACEQKKRFKKLRTEIAVDFISKPFSRDINVLVRCYQKNHKSQFGKCDNEAMQWWSQPPYY